MSSKEDTLLAAIELHKFQTINKVLCTEMLPDIIYSTAR